MSNQSKYSSFCFTLNNYSSDQEKLLGDFYNNYCEYMIYGHEEGEETHTPHLQGFLQLKNRMRLTTLKNKLGISTIHLEATKGTAKDNINYCKKDGNNIIEYGEPIVKGSNSRVKNNLREKIKECRSWKECLEIEGIEKHLKFAREYFNHIERKYDEVYKDIQLYEWQSALIEYMNTEGTSRQILFVVDRKGGRGKSFFCGYCLNMRDDVFICNNGSTSDILYIYKDNIKKNILIDTQRDQPLEELNYKLIENITNLFFTSTKYESQVVHKPFKTNTIIFTNDNNYKILSNKLSKDRIKILDLDKEEIKIVNFDEI